MSFYNRNINWTNIRFFGGLLVVIAGICGGLFIGLYFGIYRPIMDIAHAYDTDTLTGALIGKSLVCFLVRGLLSWACIVICWVLGAILMKWGD